MTTAHEIAQNIIALSGEQLTNLKLQKLLYYAQAWNLVFTDQRLFHEDIEAWVHGPVVPAVFREFKCYQWNPIDERGVKPTDEHTASLLSEVIRVYGKFTATQLERLTHQEPPWVEARGGLPPDAPSKNMICTARMKSYYSSLLNG